MPKRIATRDQAIAQVTQVFRDHGYDGASVKRLERATGLKPSSLYNYFPGGKDEMAQAALAHVQGTLAVEVVGLLGDRNRSPAQRLERFCQVLTGFYDHGRRACLLNLLSVGDAAVNFAPALRSGVRGLVQALAGLAQEVGVSAAAAESRAEDALIAIEGALVVSRALGDPAPFARTLAGLAARLLDPEPGTARPPE